MGEHDGAVLAELVEEPVQGRVVAAGSGPLEPATVVINDDGQVAVATLAGDLVNPDPSQPIEPIDSGVDVGVDPGDDRADGPPRVSQELDHRGLRGVDRQPRGLIVEVTGIGRNVLRPSDLGDDDTVVAAPDPWGVDFEEHLHRAEIEGAPAAAALTMIELR